MRRSSPYGHGMHQLPTLQTQTIHNALQAFDVPGLAIAVVQHDGVTFADNTLVFDQPQLLDVDFGELRFGRLSSGSSS
jgi:hypothetical protein